MKKYKALQPFESRKWEIGDIISMDERSASKLLEDGVVEEYFGDEPNKHVAITVDPATLNGVIKVN